MNVVKLKLSKKDIVPIITSILFISWIIIWILALLFGVITLGLTQLFYYLLPIPWIILIIIVWVNWKKIYKNLKEHVYLKTHFDPLYIKEGLVRLFQIVLIFLIFIYYIFLQINGLVLAVPVGLLVVVNAILAYFGFTAAEVLPEDYVLESLNKDVPTNKKLLNSLSSIKNGLTQFETNLKNTLDMIDKYVDESIGKASQIFEDLNIRIEEIEKIANNIPSYSFARDPFDKYNYLILVILLAVINLITQPAFAIPSYVALPTFSIFGVLIGISARSKINGTISNKLLDNIVTFKKKLEPVRDNIKSISNITEETKEEINQIFEEFKDSNFMNFLPANYSSILSIGFVSFLSLFIFILPLPAPETLFTTMQWFVLYYFTTKQ